MPRADISERFEESDGEKACLFRLGLGLAFTKIRVTRGQ